MAALPYMPLFVADFKADTAHLTLAQKGAYLELIMNYWQTGKALNNKDDRLAGILGMKKSSFQNQKEILQEFFRIEGDFWFHGRIEAELEKVHSKSTKASYAASQGARKRASERLANAERNPSHTDTDTDTDTKKDIVQISFERFWDSFPRKQGKAKAKIAFEKAIKNTEADSIIEAASKYGKDLNRVDEYTAMPATWLTGERWNDAPLPQKNSKNSWGSGIPSGPTPIHPRFTATEVISGVQMPENLRHIALGRAK
jgi:uncharacterized protein YdaU (DUF1376 family)